MTGAGVPFERLDAVDVARRWPQWRLDPGTRAIFQEAGGIADPERGNAAHQRLARRRPGRPCSSERSVSAIRDHGGELEVGVEDGRSFSAGAVVVATDAWTNDLLARSAARFRSRVTREQVTWFAADGRRGLRTRSLPGLDLAGPAVVLRRSRRGAAPARRSARTSAAARRPPNGRTSRRTSIASPGSSVPRRAGCPAFGARGADEDLPVHAHAGPGLRRSIGCPGIRASSSRSAPRTRTSSRRSSGRCSPSSRSIPARRTAAPSLALFATIGPRCGHVRRRISRNRRLNATNRVARRSPACEPSGHRAIGPRRATDRLRARWRRTTCERDRRRLRPGSPPSPRPPRGHAAGRPGCWRLAAPGRRPR